MQAKGKVALWLPSDPLLATPLHGERSLIVSFWLLYSTCPERILLRSRRNVIRTEHKRMRYVIRVKGHLDTFWQAWFDNLSITQDRDGTTLLSGQIRDQAALYGILIKMRDLGLTLFELAASAPIEQTEE